MPSLLSLLQDAKADDDSGLFAFYEQLLTLRDQHKATLPVPVMESRDTTPLVEWSDIGITEPPFYAWLTQVANLWQHQDPTVLDELDLVSPDEVLAVGERWYREGESGLSPLVDALLLNAIAPYLERAAEAVVDDSPDVWQHAHCPVCNGWCDMARYDEKRHRYRCICERCSTEWNLTRNACLFCGESDEERRGFYATEDDLYRILVCDNCGYYLKVINDRTAKRAGYTPILAAERLLTPGLDLMAAEEGYKRVTKL